MNFYFWLKFDKDPQPIHIRVGSFAELKEVLERLVSERGDFPEWIIRDYSR